MLKLKVISSTSRPGRKGPIIAKWISSVAAANPAFEVELLDLGDIHLPLMDEPFHPRLKKYQHEHTRKWSAIIDDADAFIFVTAEYNACFPAPLKNALDFLYTEWTNKPAGIVSYGGVSGGTRATQLLKPVLTAFKMMPLPEGVVISMFDRFINDQEEFIADEMLNKSAGFMLTELEKWGNALKPLRQ